MRAILICIAMGMLLAVAGCRTKNAPAGEKEPSDSHIIEVKADGVDGVIFDESAEAWFEVKVTGRWTPTVEEALEADGIARTCVEKESAEVLERYEKYKRHYLGGMRGKDRLVQINFMTIHESDDHDWKTEMIAVEDGGTDFFEVVVNLSTGVCDYVYIHGEA